MNSKIQLAVGLDAGSARTRCVICVIENGGIRYLAHGLAPVGRLAERPHERSGGRSRIDSRRGD